LLLSDYTGATLSYWERDDKEHEVQIFVACCKIRRQPITDSNLIRSPIPKLPITRSKMPDH